MFEFDCAAPRIARFFNPTSHFSSVLPVATTQRCRRRRDAMTVNHSAPAASADPSQSIVLTPPPLPTAHDTPPPPTLGSQRVPIPPRNTLAVRTPPAAADMPKSSGAAAQKQKQKKVRHTTASQRSSARLWDGGGQIQTNGSHSSLCSAPPHRVNRQQKQPHSQPQPQRRRKPQPRAARSGITHTHTQAALVNPLVL